MDTAVELDSQGLRSCRLQSQSARATCVPCTAARSWSHGPSSSSDVWQRLRELGAALRLGREQRCSAEQLPEPDRISKAEPFFISPWLKPLCPWALLWSVHSSALHSKHCWAALAEPPGPDSTKAGCLWMPVSIGLLCKSTLLRAAHCWEQAWCHRL